MHEITLTPVLHMARLELRDFRQDDLDAFAAQLASLREPDSRRCQDPQEGVR